MWCCDCIHYAKCKEISPMEDGCKDYKDKSLFIGFPCKIGATVYLPTFVGGSIGWKIYEAQVTAYSVDIGGVKMELKRGYGFREVFVNRIGKFSFLTLDDAKNYIAKRKGSNTNDE